MIKGMMKVNGEKSNKTCIYLSYSFSSFSIVEIKDESWDGVRWLAYFINWKKWEREKWWNKEK